MKQFYKENARDSLLSTNPQRETIPLLECLIFFFLQRKLSFDLIAINLVLFIYFLWQGLPVKLDPADIEKESCFSKHIMQGDTGFHYSLKSEKETTHIRNYKLHELAEEYDSGLDPINPVPSRNIS